LPNVMIKVDCLAAGVLLREIGAVLVILLLSWRTICASSQPMGNKGWRVRKSVKTRWSRRSMEI
jgi:hypothetical protein